MKKLILTLAFFFPIFSCMELFAKNNISVSSGKFSDYYHIKYTLKKSNFLIPKGNKPIYSGQFEILLKKEKFPIAAKNCKGNLILRMPSTLSTAKNKKIYINAKINLLHKIQEVFDNKKESVDVIIELNPYVSVISKKPLKLELTNCNIFFRSKGDKYINHL